MTPEEHYAKAEAHAKTADSTHGAAPDAALKHAILAVAHALMAHPPYSREDSSQ